MTLVSGPVNVPDPLGVNTVKVETAQEMFAAVTAALPADVAVFAAAVADWRVDQPNANKIKKQAGGSPTLGLVENPDILATVAHDANVRPRLVIGFAAETEHIIEHAKAKLARKGCDWIVANDVSAATRRDGRRSQYRASGDRAGGGILAAAIERAGGAARSSPGSPTTLAGADAVNKVELRIMRLPHAADLPLPAYQSEHAAGLDLVAAVPADAPVVIAPGERAAIPTGIRDCAASGGRRADPAALRARAAAWGYRAQLAGHRGCRLSRRSPGNPCQFRHATVPGRARRAHCPIGPRGYNASGDLRSCKS